MKQVLIKDGGVVVEEVPAPVVGSRNVLVQVDHSCVSAGTELAGVRMSGLPLYRRALKQPENVRKVLAMARDQGFRRTVERVLGTLAFGTPTGYSAAGRVIAVGDQVEGFSVGDIVACAGAGVANHAEVIDVPVNLAVAVPQGLDTRLASTVTLGAIALQGVRRCNPTLGETVVVVGLGILGQLTAQMLQANGCRVVGIDVDERRIRLAKENGLEHGFDSRTDDHITEIVRLTGGAGADASIITAASSSDEIVSEAARCCRRKGRVVLVGDVGLKLQRSDFYAKELDFLISTSYGPGRYDPLYEEGGQDYPLAYVRWTENRNMQAYLALLASAKIRLDNLLGDSYDVEQAAQAYSELQSGRSSGVLTILSYPGKQPDGRRAVAVNPTSKGRKGTRSVAVVGAGGFAQAMHLPNLLRLRDRFRVHAIASRTGVTAKGAATRFGASYATTDFEEVLNDVNVEAVIICTRHDLHAQMAIRALAAGKHVLVEKPLAVNEAQLVEIERFVMERQSVDLPILMTGFNRRFSPALTRARQALTRRSTPLIVNYRMNAGYVPSGHWVHSAEGGGRNIGEACHVYDVFNFLTGSTPIDVTARSITPPSEYWARNDNFVATLRYADGSVCTLTYTALGSKSYPKERMEIFAGGFVIELDDYRSLRTIGGRSPGWSSRVIEKGQLQELGAFADGIASGVWPISFADQVAATRVSFQVEAQIRAPECT